MSIRADLARIAAVTALAVSVVACSHGGAPRNMASSANDGAETRVAMAPGLVASAAAYERYMTRAGDIRANFTSGAAVREALIAGVSYEPRQLREGAIAYAALAALQDQGFVRSVQSLDHARQAALAAQIAANPAAALQLRGADGAAARAAGALRDQGSQVVAAGRAVKQAAYDVQHQKWSKVFVPDRPSRLARAKALSAARFQAGPEDRARVVQAAAAARGGSRGAQTAVVQRAVALAALTAMGRDGDDRLVAPLLAEPRSADCLKMAKLNLFQCLAVAGPHYEDVFCLGQHALIDTGQCVAEAGGAPKPARRAEIDLGGSALAQAAPRTTATPAPIVAASVG